ncbi:hypothetical protein GQR58_025141 [Nymphon striatum]|nr:hypothetical protein GQR58_025141 [Nymphon striatum]
MSLLKPPGPLTLDAKHWDEWLRAFELYMCASELGEKPAKVQCATFLHVAGAHAQQLYATFDFSADERDRLDILQEKFRCFCQPKKNLTVSRFKFNTRRQLSGEAFDSFLLDLKELSRACEFGEIKDSLIRDRIICGIGDSSLQRRLLQENNVSLDKCADVCRSFEMSAIQATAIQTPVHEDMAVDNISRHNISRHRPQHGSGSDSRQGNGEAMGKCKYCTFVHVKGRCPAYNQKCRRCNAVGHFRNSRLCRRQGGQRSTDEITTEDETDIGDTSTTTDQKYIDAIGKTSRPFTVYSYINDVSKCKYDDWCQNLIIDDVNIKFKLDSGAQVNILPDTIYSQTNLPLIKSNIALRSYSGHNIKCRGKTLAEVKLGLKSYKILFYVVNGDSHPILGKHTCEKLGLLTKGNPYQPEINSVSEIENPIIKKNNDIFNGLGTLINHTYEIALKAEVIPVQHPPRTVPYKLRNKIKAELDRMVELGVITQVTEPTDWVSSMAIVHKPNGELRICLDPRDLNTAIRREHYPMPTVENIAARMPLAKVFSKFDAASGPRLQRMRLHLLRYDLEINWRPGREMFVPDALSRHSKQILQPSGELNDTLEINSIVNQLPIIEHRLETLKQETAKDDELQLVQKLIVEGWPADKVNIPRQATPYVPFKDELVSCSGLIFNGHRLIIPHSLRPKMIQLIHAPHQGIVKSKQRARMVVFWPGMNAQIEDAVARCSTCQSSRKLISHDIPDRPWAKLGADIFHLNRKDYILVVDYYSKFPEMLNSRVLKSLLPTSIELLKPHVVPPMKQKLEARQLKQKLYHDKRSQDLSELTEGQNVRFLNAKKELVPGTVVTKHNPRSYLIKLHNQNSFRTFRRNRRLIHPSQETFDKTPPYTDVSIAGNNEPIQEGVRRYPNYMDYTHAGLGTLGHSDSDPNQIDTPTQQTSCRYNMITIGRPCTTSSGRIVKPTRIIDA